MTPIEKEFKWAVNTKSDFSAFVQALNQLIGPLPEAKIYHITDTYLDNAAHTLYAQKTALRIRQVDSTFEATLKSRTKLVDGLAVRQEYTLPLEAASWPEALACLERKQDWQGVAMQGLTVRFRIVNLRRIYMFSNQKLCCEAALDEYEIQAQGKCKKCMEIELELKGGEEQDFLNLAKKISARTGLQAAQISKVATAEKMLKS